MINIKYHKLKQKKLVNEKLKKNNHIFHFKAKYSVQKNLKRRWSGDISNAIVRKYFASSHVHKIHFKNYTILVPICQMGKIHIDCFTHFKKCYINHFFLQSKIE